MAKTKKKLFLFITGSLVVAFFSWRLFYFRQLGLAEIPAPEILDEFDFVWTGKTWFKSGLPLGWSGFRAYREKSDSADSVDVKNFELYKGEERVNFSNRKKFEFPMTMIKEIDYGLGKMHLNLVAPYFDHPPLASWVYGLAKTGDSFESTRPAEFRKVSLYLALISGLLIFVFLFLEKGLFTALLGFFIFQTAPSFILLSRLSLAENLIIPLSLLFLVFLEFYKNNSKPIFLLLAGAAAGLAGLAKIPGLFLVLAGVLFLFFNQKLSFKNAIRFLLPCGIIFGFYPFYGFLVAPDLFLKIFVTQSSRRFFGSLTFLKQISFPKFKNFFIDGWWLGGWIIGLASLFRGKKDDLAWIGLVSLLVVTSFMSAADFPWYFLTAIPFLVIFTTRFLMRIWQKPKLGELVFFALVFLASAFHWGKYKIAPDSGSNLNIFRFFVLFLAAAGALPAGLKKRWWFKTGWRVLFLVILHRLYLWNLRSLTYIVANWGNL